MLRCGLELANPVLPANSRLAAPGAGQEDEAPGPEEQELQPAVEAQGESEVEPFAPPLVDESGADGCGEDAGGSKEHEGDAPAEVLSVTEPVEDAVGGHPVAQEDAGVGAGIPDSVQEHEVGLAFARRTIAVWLVLSGCVPERFLERSALLDLERRAWRVIDPAAARIPPSRSGRKWRRPIITFTWNRTIAGVTRREKA